MKTLLASLLVGAAAAASSPSSGGGLRGAACAAPVAGSSVQSLVCTTAGAAITWRWNATNVYAGLGTFTNVGNPSQCMAVSGTIAADGAPGVALQPCNPADAAQQWSFLLDGRLISGLNAQCLDLEGGNQAPNQLAELWGCSGNANQLFTFNTTTGTLTDSQWGYCLGVC
jgi:hypothetical protein